MPNLGDEIPGMNGLCWSDLPLTDEEIEILQMSNVFEEETDGFRAESS